MPADCRFIAYSAGFSVFEYRRSPSSSSPRGRGALLMHCQGSKHETTRIHKKFSGTMKFPLRASLIASFLLLVQFGDADNYVAESDPLCVHQDPAFCQGAFRCDNSTLDTLGCFFWVYDSGCKSLRPNNPWPGVRAGQSLSFDGLEHDINIQNVSNSLEEDKIEVVFKYENDSFGFGMSQYLTSVERRLQRLENLFAQLLPDVNLEEALASSPLDNPANSPIGTRSPKTPDFNAPEAVSAIKREPGGKISEAVPQEADGFDWQEDFSELADGMAALSVNPKGTGYLGSTAGVFFLRSLLLWMGRSTSMSDGHGVVAKPPRAEEQSTFSSTALHSLVSRPVMNQLIDSYFAIYHVSYPFIHEATFRAQFHEIIPRPSHRSWQMLLSTVLALGAWCMSHPSGDLHDDLYHYALSLGEDESMFESGNFTFVQALVLLSNLSQKRNKPNTGSNFLGLAVRMALSLGLHRELPDWDISLLQRELRRRIWWGLYIFDSGASTTFGRPILLPGMESMDVHSVLNIDDESLTPRTEILPPESTGPTIYSGLKYQSSFHVQSNHISNRLLSASGISREEALSLNQTLESWSKTLPPYFQISHEPVSQEQWYLFARSKLWWRFWNMRIILFLQVLLGRSIERDNVPANNVPHAFDKTCRDICIEAAHLSIISIHQYLSRVNPSRVESWYSVFFIFHASLVMVLAILADNGSSPQLLSWQADIETVRQVFRHLLADNPLAARCADILDRILQPEPDVLSLDSMEFLNTPSYDFLTWPEGDGGLFSSHSWLGPRQGFED
ncbi:putative C6 transcription factor [Seiridium unicorne]|uniref:C6 transcription factor n=1 Tax=Seiridium unicorne TaxID=138068 RepID=A0ABR2UFN7_9PEZI